MRFLADEGVDRQIVEKLRTEGHDVLYIAEIDAGINDERVLELSNEEERILMTRERIKKTKLD